MSLTSGPTIEQIDPVRFISNNSSGKQGHAIADALRRHGADTKLISGPVNIKDPENMKVTKVNSAEEMLHECRESLPVDIAVFAAAVSDWKCSKTSNIKIKKTSENDELNLNLEKNQDILKEISTLNKNRPNLVIGFSLETDNLIETAKEKGHENENVSQRHWRKIRAVVRKSIQPRKSHCISSRLLRKGQREYQ